ncbi:MAG: glycoside hydrolase family 99-like domain-containing protein [Alphaproteobacteria bacterium]|nr:glycoside hydrolase family 99-like domain-containing protein [Alphaproteobacteria bacterium]
MSDRLPTALKGVAPAGSAGRYQALTDDPQMLWRVEKADRPRFDGVSAVRITVRLNALDGKISAPCVYGDWGDGFSEESRKALTHVSGDLYTGVALSNAGSLRQLRVDPSSAPCLFEIAEFVVQPATAPSATIRRVSTPKRLIRAVILRLPAPVQHGLRDIVSTLRDPRRGLRRLSQSIGASRGPWRDAYVRSVEIARNLRSPQFAAPALAPPRREADAPKVLAFYLPQFHPFPENDRWWGKGFTEWTNVSKAAPQFTGHLQPRLPGELGFYDLRTPETLRDQAALAKIAGVDAFCFHYYWFGGHRLLERPLDAFVADETIDLPFALCWANENWTRRWDGQESDILMAQNHSPKDDIALFDDLARYIASPRYVRVDGKPLIVVYRPDILPDAAATVKRWRDRARKVGIGELFLLCTNAFGFSDYRTAGFDGLVEFPPHALAVGEITDTVQRLNPQFAGRVYDYGAVVADRVEALASREDPRRYPGVMPSWDNEARKPGAGHVFHNAAPDLFHPWVEAALDCTARLAPPQERLVFVNAWNEWGEGAYLEPDRWFGHGSAQALRTAIEARAPRLTADHPLVAASTQLARGHDAVLLVHIFYADLIPVFAKRVARLRDKADVIVTFPDHWSEAELRTLAKAIPGARLVATPNRGRDIAPFLTALKIAADQGHTIFCKIHSKKSPHMANGAQWRDTLLDALVAPEAAETALQRFTLDPRLGLLAPDSARMRLGDHAVMFNNGPAMDFLAKRLNFQHGPDSAFAAGSMFWGRVTAFKALHVLAAADYPFEPELGRIDGTLAHAFERAMGAVVLASGHGVQWDL